MARFHFSCAFVYSAAPEAMCRGLATWLHGMGDSVRIKFGASNDAGVPDVEFFRSALANCSDDSIWLAYQLTTDGGSGRGTLEIARPSEKPEASRLELRFSINARGKGLFVSGEEVRRALISAAAAFDVQFGQVEAEDFSDEESSRKYAVFQNLGDRRVPVSIEWVTVIPTGVFQSIGWETKDIARVPGVRVGEERGYVWIVLCEAPFSYRAHVGTEAQRQVEAALDLPARQQARRDNRSI